MADYGQEPLTPSIPDPNFASTEDVLRAIKEWVEVRQGTRGDWLDRAVTMRDLLNSGLATPGAIGEITPPGFEIPQLPPGVSEPDIPPTPTNLLVTGGVTSMIITFDFARGYSRLSHFEIWRSQTDDIGTAVLIAQTYSTVFTDETGPGVKFYYWVRAVSDAGTSPFNAVAGTLGETAIDVEEVIDVITDEINDSGLLEQLTIKVDSRGKGTGWGMADTPRDGEPTSSFAVVADRFLVAPPVTAPGLVERPLFTVQTLPTTVNGVVAPAGVYMTDAYIMNGVITSAKIGNLAVDDAKIASVSVSKITAGQLSVGAHIESTGFQSGQSGFRITGAGNAEFNNATVRGTIYATHGAIGNILITASSIQSSNYNGSTAGFRIDSGGNANFGNGYFRGTVHATSGTFSGSLNAATGTFSGSLNAATGTFRGGVMGGAFTGYNWPTGGQTGFYLGPPGLLMGNANISRFVNITSDGDIYTPGFQVSNGVMTVHQANVIDTLHIAGEAVTIPRGASAVYYYQTAGGNTHLLSLPQIDPGWSPVMIWAMANGQAFDNTMSYPLTLQVRRNGAVIFTSTPFDSSPYSAGVNVMLIDYPGGPATYTLWEVSTVGKRMTTRAIVAVACKR